MNPTANLRYKRSGKVGPELARREFLLQSVVCFGTTALAGVVAGCVPPRARKAQRIVVGTPTIDRIDCDGCFEGSVPVSVTWAAGAGNTAGVKITFDASTFQNVLSVKAASNLADDVMYGTDANVGISGCLKDPCQDGSFLFTAKTPSSVTIANANQTVTVSKLGYSVAGLKDTNGTSDDPNKPFVPINITITNCGAAAGNFAITVTNQRNCAALAAAPAAVMIGAGATSPPIKISGNKVDGHTGGRFKLAITPPAGRGMQPCDHSVRVE